jgi:hypothetical protein
MHTGRGIGFVEVEVNLPPTLSRPVCLGVRHPSGTRDQFFFLLEIFFTQLQVCYRVAPSLTKGRVCNLVYNCFWALPEQSFLGRSPAEFTAIFYCPFWDSPNLEGQIPIFISPRNRVTQLYPRALGSLLSPLTTRGDYGGGILRGHRSCCTNQSTLRPTERERDGARSGPIGMENSNSVFLRPY